MCFSASASFIASGILTALGLMSMWGVKQPRFYLFASIPFLFAIQQAAEGCVWLYHSHLAAVIFLFFALVIWPTVIPAALFLIEKNKKMRQRLKYFLVLGLLFSLFLLISLIISRPEFSAQGCHIIYFINPVFFLPHALAALLYCSVTIVPFFISTRAYMELLGMLAGLSCFVSYLFFTVYFTSVWCFFAAVISGSVAALVYRD